MLKDNISMLKRKLIVLTDALLGKGEGSWVHSLTVGREPNVWLTEIQQEFPENIYVTTKKNQIFRSSLL